MTTTNAASSTVAATLAVWQTRNLVGVVTTFLTVPDLHCWRQCNRLTLECADRYYRGSFGPRVWEQLRRDYPHEMIDAVRDFLTAVGDTGQGAVTGSAVLQVVAGEPWPSRDLDLIAVLSRHAVDAFMTLIRRLGQSAELTMIRRRDKDVDGASQEQDDDGQETDSFDEQGDEDFDTKVDGNVQASHHDSEDRDHLEQQQAAVMGCDLPGLLRLVTAHFSLATSDGDGFCTPGVCQPGVVRTPPTCEQETEACYDLLRPVESLWLTHVRQRHANMYQKHHRSVYYTLHLVDPATKHLCQCERDDDEEDHCEAIHYHIDLLLVPEPDVVRAGGTVFRWMALNFDLDICANALSARGALACLAPHDLLARRAVMRMDQYCLNVELFGPPKASRPEHEGQAAASSPGQPQGQPAPPPTKHKPKDPKKRHHRRPLSSQQRLDVSERVGMLTVADLDWIDAHIRLSPAAVRFRDDEAPCNCVNIIPRRILKYVKRGYDVQIGGLLDARTNTGLSGDD